MALLGFGASITFASGFFAEITNITIDGVTREKINTSSMATTNNYHTYTPAALVEPGEMTVELLFNPDTTLPITNAAETVTLTYRKPTGKTNAASYQSSGFLIDISEAIPLNDKMTATAKIAFSGPPTQTASS